MKNHQTRFNLLSEELEEKGISADKVLAELREQRIETPSWGYANSGTRFGVFHAELAAESVFEKIDDASIIHGLSGNAPSIALHIPWDKTEDWRGLKEYARSRGIEIGAINPNLFQDQDYKLGSIANPDPKIREKALEHLSECCQIMKDTESKILSVWLADGTNYAGQDSIINRKQLVIEALKRAHGLMPDGARLLLEYKMFEPAFYHTDVADWGTAFAMCQKIGPRAEVLVDTGHHALATNIAYIVAQLLDERRLGGFHFNSRQYADDDLIVGSANPWELFVIFVELVSAGSAAKDVAYMIDQSHNIEPKLEAMLLSVLNCQAALCRALIVDYSALKKYQVNGDVLGAHRVLCDAFETDIRPLLIEFRSRNRLPLDPLSMLREGQCINAVGTRVDLTKRRIRD
jgi:L-rhamnose isomerase / sugar isomerase